jgi:hypothetical protein
MPQGGYSTWYDELSAHSLIKTYSGGLPVEAGLDFCSHPINVLDADHDERRILT